MGGKVTHGMSRSYAYKAHGSMMARCYNPSHRSYRYYGGRENKPIRVCTQWHDRLNFLKDAVILPGYDPHQKKTLDRIDVNGDYCPENCRWVSNIKQQNNRSNNVRFEWKGVSHTLAEIARMEGIAYSVLCNIYEWNHQSLSVDEMVCKAKEKRNYNIAEIARRECLPYSKLYYQHVVRGKSVDDAIRYIKSSQHYKDNRI